MKYMDDSKVDTYQEWQEAQRIPVHKGFFIQDLRKLEVGPWDLKGGSGAFVNLEGTGSTNDGYVCEIPPGKQLKPQKHLDNQAQMPSPIPKPRIRLEQKARTTAPSMLILK